MVIKKSTIQNKLAVYIFCLAVILKQFYLLPSGSFQLGDLFFMLFFGICFVQKRIMLSKKDLFLVAFFFLAAIVNIISYVAASFEVTKYADSSFTIILFYLYNFLIVFAFENTFDDKDSLELLCRAMKLALLIQIAVYVLGIGRWYGGSRYKGTFNDPNQYGFFIMTAFFVIFNVGRVLKEKNTLIWCALSVFLILLSSSTGMMLGLMSFVGFTFLMWIKVRVSKSIFIVICCVAIVLGVCLFVLLFYSDNLISTSTIQNEAIRRLLEKINEFSGGFVKSFAADRNMMRVIKYPEMMLLGSGEGMGKAWGIDFNEGGDIHSDFFSIVFSYGIIPSSFLFIWFFFCFKGISAKYVGVYLGLLAESFTLVNHRQPLFWCFIVMASFEVFQRDKQSNDVSRQICVK